MYIVSQIIKSKIPYWIVALFLFAFGIILSHEYSVNEIDLRRAGPYILLDKNNNTKDIYDLLEGKELQPVVCLIDEDIDNLEEHVYLAGREESITKLFDQTDLTYGEQKRLFGLSKSFEYTKTDELENLALSKQIDSMFIVLLADLEVIKKIPAEWLWENRIGNILFPTQNIHSHVFPKILSVWIIICIVCIFLIYLNIEVNRKIFYIQMLNGVGDGYIIFTDLILNGLYYIALAVLGYCCCRFWGPILWNKHNLALICIGLLCCEVVGIYLMFRINIRKVFTTDIGDYRILVMSFLLKGVVAIFILLAISLNGKGISDYLELTKNYEFYDMHRNYYWITEPEHDAWEDYYNYYREESERGNAELYTYLYTTNEGKHVYKINNNTLTWIKKIYPSLSDCNTDKNLILAPKDCSKKTIDHLETLIKTVNEEKVVIEYYKEERYLPLLGAGKDERVESSNDIIFVLYESSPNGENEYEPDFLWAFYRLDEGVARINDNISIRGNSVADSFFKEYKIRRTMLVFSLLSVIILITFETGLTVYIVHIEFRMNSKLFMLRRINGMGILGTYLFLFLADIITVTFGMNISLFVGAKIIENYNMMISGVEMLVMIIIELVAEIICVIVNEKRNIIKTFKAGGL